MTALRSRVERIDRLKLAVSCHSWTKTLDKMGLRLELSPALSERFRIKHASRLAGEEGQHVLDRFAVELRIDFARAVTQMRRQHRVRRAAQRMVRGQGSLPQPAPPPDH